MKVFKPRTWIHAALLAVPVVATQVVVSQLQADLGWQPLSVAMAQEKKGPDTRETRRTPALRNNVYEKLAAAQEAAEAKDMNGAASILDGMISSGGNVWRRTLATACSNCSGSSP